MSPSKYNKTKIKLHVFYQCEIVYILEASPIRLTFSHRLSSMIVSWTRSRFLPRNHVVCGVNASNSMLSQRRWEWCPINQFWLPKHIASKMDFQSGRKLEWREKRGWNNKSGGRVCREFCSQTTEPLFRVNWLVKYSPQHCDGARIQADPEFKKKSIWQLFTASNLLINEKRWGGCWWLVEQLWLSPMQYNINLLLWFWLQIVLLY